MGPEEAQASRKSVSGEMAECRRQIRLIASEWVKDLHSLRRYEKEGLRLSGKDFGYRIDVELDQIMAYFRVARVNLSSWFLHECLAKHPMSRAQFLHNILRMPAEIELTKDARRIKLKRNPKDPEGMIRLEPAIQRLNALKIEHLDGRRIEFAVI